MKITLKLPRGKKYFRHLVLGTALCMLNSGLSFAQIAVWDFAQASSPATHAAGVYNTNLDSSPNVTRGPGAAASTASNSFRTQGFMNDGINVSNTDYFQVTFSASPGYLLSLSSIDARIGGTGTFANSPGVTSQFAYSVNGTTFTLIGSPQVTVGTPANIAQVDLSGITALQDLADNITVTLRYYASGQTTSGGWGFISQAAAGTPGLVIGGTVEMDCPDLEAPVASGTAICAGAEATLAATATGSGTLTWYDAATDGTDLHTGASWNVEDLTENTSYWVSESVPSCPEGPRTEVVVTVNPLPAVDAGNDIMICEGSSVTLGVAGPDTYSWDNNVVNGVPFSPEETETYTVTADNGTCTNTDEVSIFVSTPSIAGTASVSDNTTCYGTSVTLSVTGETGTIHWFVQPPGNPNFYPSGAGNNVLTPVQQTPGVYLVKAQVINGACPEEFTDVLTIEIFPLPTVNAGVDQTVCEGEAVTLSATSLSTAFAWDNGVVDGDEFTPAATADYEVTVTDVNGCTNTDIVTVTVNELPAVDAGADQALCPNVALVLEGSGAETYAWDNDVEDGISFLPGETTTYTVTGTDANGCVNTDEITVTVGGIIPDVDAGADQQICIGSEVTLTAVSTDAGVTAYVWDNAVEQDEAFEPVETMTYIVTVDNGECLNTDTVTVIVNEPSVAGTVSLSDTTVCAGATTILTLTGETGTIEWFISENGTDFDPAGSGNDLETAPLTTAPSYIVKAEVTNGACAAVTSDELTIEINTLPVVDAGSDQTVCAGSSVTLEASGAAVAYAWDNDVEDGVPFGVLTTAIYTLTGTDENGCSATDEVTVTVNPLPALPVITADGPLTLCEGDQVVLTSSEISGNTWSSGQISASITVETAGAYTVTYTDENECTSTSLETVVVVNALPVATASVSNHTTITASPAGQTYKWINCANNQVIANETAATFVAEENGSYQVVVTNSNGCSDTSACVEINTVGFDEAQNDLGVSVYPNPTAGEVYLQMPGAEQADVVVSDMQGKVIAVISGAQNGAVIDLKEAQNGVYMIRYTNSKGSGVSRIVKK